MAYYTQEQIEKAREMDLLTYLQNYEPQELVHVTGKTFSTREHDSLKISNGKWMWWSRGFGGASALDYLVKVRGDPFTKAMEKILGQEARRPPIFVPKAETAEPAKAKKLLLPERSPTTDVVRSYLAGRGIDPEIIGICIRDGLIYESLPHHNCIFVGFDRDGEARYASFRATKAEKVMGEAAGSDKKYSFRIEPVATPETMVGDNRTGRQSIDRTLHVFESAIDLLSFATKMKHLTGDWRAEPMLSLGGVYAPRGDPTQGKLPISMAERLKDDPNILSVALHLDNDFAGREAAKMIQTRLGDRYEIRNDPPRFGKDMNDELMHMIQKNRKKERETHVR